VTPAVASAGQVLALFLIPIGGGIPPGVLLAQARGLPWPETAALYFVSDVILALIFEPFLLLAAEAGRGRPRLARFAEAMRASVRRMAALYGGAGGPFALFLVAFGVDPMTGRTAAKLAGHGFFSGWTIAIAGDMLYFAVIMASTLWLRSVLGSGTVAALVVLAAMIVVPLLVARLRRRH
jgi:hypothetical protein